MKTAVRLVLVLGVLATTGVAQPNDGDLVLSMSHWTPTTTYHHVVYVDPANPGTLTTLATAPSDYTYSWLRMAPNNTDLVVAMPNGKLDRDAVVELPIAGSPRILVLAPSGIVDFELDHDGRWIATSRGSSRSLFGVHHPSGLFTTFASLGQRGYPGGLAIDREPGMLPYVVPDNQAGGRPYAEWVDLRGHDRQGKSGLIASPDLTAIDSVELHPRTGDYVALGEDDGVAYAVRVARSGKTSRLALFTGTAAKITQDDHIWIAGSPPGPNKRAVLKYGLSQNAVVTLIQTPFPSSSWLRGLEVYGSRRLVCNGSGQPGTSVKVNLQSRKPGNGSKSYLLACSRNRRPGARFAHGEWLHLDVTDPLFLTSALGLAPAIFQSFQGTTDQNGNASAQVNIPRNLPPNLGVTIFVSGVIYDSSGVLTVTNTHWFVLP